MAETKSQSLSGVEETSLIPLYIRALETQRPDGMIKDDLAKSLVLTLRDHFPGA